MSRIKEAFNNGKVFVPFVTGGDPEADFTVKLVLGMFEAGADIVEIGVPFSDPIAEGPVIQEANIRALSKGMTTDGIFDIVRRVREKTDKPICLMGYLNPVFHYGYEEFFKKASESGVDGVIIADLPYEEKEEADGFAQKYDIDIISLIAPTSEERVKMIAADAKGFIYLVSSMGVTGVRSSITTDVAAIAAKIKEVTNTPVAVGFGISTPEQAADMAEKSDGAIVGSAIVRQVAAKGTESYGDIVEYVRQMAKAVHEA